MASPLSPLMVWFGIPPPSPHGMVWHPHSLPSWHGMVLYLYLNFILFVLFIFVVVFFCIFVFCCFWFVFIFLCPHGMVWHPRDSQPLHGMVWHTHGPRPHGNCCSAASPWLSAHHGMVWHPRPHPNGMRLQANAMGRGAVESAMGVSYDRPGAIRWMLKSIMRLTSHERRLSRRCRSCFIFLYRSTRMLRISSSAQLWKRAFVHSWFSMSRRWSTFSSQRRCDGLLSQQSCSIPPLHSSRTTRPCRIKLKQ